MSDDINLNLEELAKALKKSKDEFDIAANLVASALSDVHERLERIERWITESGKETISQKNQES